MNVISTSLSGVLLLELDYHEDQRGGFAELFSAPRYQRAGIADTFVQTNYSFSKKNTLRGLHLQQEQPQGKLITACQGQILDVVVDIDPHSPSFGQHLTFELNGLSSECAQQLWIPAGYAHGFYVLSETATVLYQCTALYDAKNESGVIWNDPDLNIPWPTSTPTVSQRDQSLPTLQQWAEQYL